MQMTSLLVRIWAPGRVRRVDFLLIGWKLMVARFRATSALVKGQVALVAAPSAWSLAQIFCIALVSFCCGGIFIFVWLIHSE